MTLPTLLLGVVISSLYGAAFHLFLGGNLGKLFLFLSLSWIGFWTGHVVGNQLNLIFLSLGVLRLGTATIGSLLFLGIGYWLFVVDRSER
jgi:hypothetical protein